LIRRLCDGARQKTNSASRAVLDLIEHGTFDSFLGGQGDDGLEIAHYSLGRAARRRDVGYADSEEFAVAGNLSNCCKSVLI
jgi:hypothetical protein